MVIEHSTIFTRIGDVDTRSFHLAYYVVMEHSTIFTGIDDVDTRSFHLAYYGVMEHSTIFTRIGDVDTRSFHWHGRDIGFPCFLGYNKQERPLVVDHYIYKHFTYSLKSTTDKQASTFMKSFGNFYSKASKVF